MPEISQFTVPVTQNGQTTNVTYSFKDSTARSSSVDTSDFVKKTGNNTLSGLFEPTSDAGADLGRNGYRFNNIYGYYIYGEELDLDKPLSIANGGTGVSSIDDLKNALDVESFSTPTRVNEETIDTLSGTVVFDGVNAPFGQNVDWAGIQIGSSAGTDGDMFQLATVNNSDKKLLFRKNDSGEWGDWERVCFYSELPVVDSSMSSTSTNPVQNKVINTALGNKLDSSTVDSSGSSGTSGWYNCRLSNGKIQYYNTNTTYSTTSSVTSGSSALLTSGGAYTALSAKANSSDLGTAASKSYTTSVTSGSSNLVTSGGVYTELHPSNFTISKQSTTAGDTIAYTARCIGNLVIINICITTGAKWSSSGNKGIATIPSAYRPSITYVTGDVMVSGTYESARAWINTSGQIQMKYDFEIPSGATITIAFAYSIGSTSSAS